MSQPTWAVHMPIGFTINSHPSFYATPVGKLRFTARGNLLQQLQTRQW